METKTKVIFRYWRGNVIALFPEIPGDSDPSTCSSYEHIGQHGAADYTGIVRQSRRATYAEATSLYVELENIGYRLQVCQRITPAMTKARMAELKRTSCS